MEKERCAAIGTEATRLWTDRPCRLRRPPRL